ncbi:14-3-3 domain-containing protein [Favolaschia claudopus]|uniref:14-3-3 domain-containing protein n=1 Tax=Favolaschia claudopus TaxID=2862362 RepID=A0AAV9Z775_9AGAR
MSREQSMHLARLADKANRFGDMLEYMKAVVTSGIDLTSEERNLFCAAYKMTVDSHRRSWKVITSVEKSGEVTGHPIHLALARKCKAKIEKDLTHTCEEVLHTLETQLISGAISHEARVFFQKMAGDYYRYLAEVAAEDTAQGLAQSSLEAYTRANAISAIHLAPTNPIRLGLTLNLSVYYYEIAKSFSMARDTAIQAIDSAIPLLESLTEAEYSDAVLPIQILQLNLARWTFNMSVDGMEEEP